MRDRGTSVNTIAGRVRVFVLLCILPCSLIANAEKPVDEREINERVEQLGRTIERAEALRSELDVAIPADKTALEYRLDETSIETLGLIDQISVGIAQLPEGNITRDALMERFSGGLLVS